MSTEEVYRRSAWLFETRERAGWPLMRRVAGVYVRVGVITDRAAVAQLIHVFSRTHGSARSKR